MNLFVIELFDFIVIIMVFIVRFRFVIVGVKFCGFVMLFLGLLGGCCGIYA